MYIKHLTVLILLTTTLMAGCTKTEDVSKPIDESAAGRAAAAISASSSPFTSSEKTNGDLAKIRQIKEQEQSENKAAKESSQSKSAEMAKGAAKPLRDLKY